MIYPLFFIGFFLFLGNLNFIEAESNQSGSANFSKEDLKKFYQEKINFLEQGIEDLRQKIADEQTKEQLTLNDLKENDLGVQKLNLEIEELNYEISFLEGSISDKQSDIENLTNRMSLEKRLINQLLQSLYETKNNFSILKAFFLGTTFSNIFNSFTSLQLIQSKIITKISSLKDLKVQAEQNVEDLRTKKEDLNQLKALNFIQQRELSLKEANKERILFEIQAAQQSYVNTILITKKDINKIKEQLYILEGLGVQLSFEDAYNYAKVAENKTGVRSAFLLALLKKESEWGGNIGKGNWQEDLYNCYLSLGKIDRANNEKGAFLKIVNDLGLDPSTVPVSKAPSYGCGGALGPAQFLPTIWLEYRDAVTHITGKSSSSPFIFSDAIIAAALKIKDLGGANLNKKSEWNAAQKYFAGSRWQNSKYYFYGDSVMELTNYYQGEINVLEGKN